MTQIVGIIVEVHRVVKVGVSVVDTGSEERYMRDSIGAYSIRSLDQVREQRERGRSEVFERKIGNLMIFI